MILRVSIRVLCLLLILKSSTGQETKTDAKPSMEEIKIKRIDPQTVVVEKELGAVNARFEEKAEYVDEEFREDMQTFRESDVLDDVEKSAPAGREATGRAMGGFILNLGQFKNGKYVPGNVFGPKYETHLIEDACTSVGFPYICELREMIDNRFKCPVNIPYCQRIPCGGNPEFNRDMFKCLKQPGCCFDQVLYNYRNYYGQTVLPRVPVCHMAVRNKHFQQVARKFSDRYRGWNPLLTNCLIKSHRNRIEKNLMECQTLDILEYFGYKAKFAGWTDILPRECGLIGGCWRPGFGCFYPPRMTNIQLRSTYTHPTSRPYSPFDLYGQPMCLPMDPYAESGDFLDSYHQCLASGCQLDPAVTPNVLLYHLYNVSSQLPPHLVNSYKYEIMLGKVRPDNWKDQLDNFIKYGKSHPFAYGSAKNGPPQPNLPPPVPALLVKFPGQSMPAHMSSQMGPYPRSFSQPPQSYAHDPIRMLSMIAGGQSPMSRLQGVYRTPPTQFRKPNPNAFISSHQMFQPNMPLMRQNHGGIPGQIPGQTSPYPPTGRRMYATTSPKMNLYPMPCPYTLVRIPNFPPLDGKVDGCCDRNLCYVPRDSVRQQYSGAAAYWGPWGFWSRCSVACGNAVQKRYRTCVGPEPASCAGPREDRRSCYNLPSCKEKTTKWSQWTTCNRTCGGYRSRSRKCLSPICQGSMRDRRACPTTCTSAREKAKREKKSKS